MQASSDSGLSEVQFFFRNDVSLFMNGQTSGSASANGLELGEGQGTLGVQVRGNDGAFTTRAVAYIDDTVLPATGAELRFGIADDWVVSGYELTVDGNTFIDELKPG